MTCRTERRGRVLVVTLDRPAKRNAIDAATTAALDAALNELDDDPDLWAGVLTGGRDVFCAGTDLVSGSGAETERGGVYGAMRRRRGTPLIAAVEGIAYGGGFELVLACDLVVAARSARFALPEVARGLVAASGALFLAPRALPRNIAREMLLTAGPLSAARLAALGLVNVLSEDGTALDDALALAERVVANGPTALRATLHALHQLAEAESDAGWAVTAGAVATVASSQDLVEGLAAFRERRAPRWTGR